MVTQSAANCRNIHTHMDLTHDLTHFTVTTTWCEAPAQLLFFSACWVFSCFCNPPNSDMDYRVFIMRTWSFLCVRAHTGVGHTDSKSAQHFWLGKTHKFFLCSWQDSNLHPLDPSLILYQLSHPVTLWKYKAILLYSMLWLKY